MQLGRVVTVFEIGCKFALELEKAFVLRVGDDKALVTLSKEHAVVEVVDSTNALRAVPAPDGSTTYRFDRPPTLPDPSSGNWQGHTLVAGKQSAMSADELAVARSNALVVTVFDSFGEPIVFRSGRKTTVAVAIERTEAEWLALGNLLDLGHETVWDEFVRTYHAQTGDVAPPYWDSSHGFMAIRQGWVPYDAAMSAMDWRVRIGQSVTGSKATKLKTNTTHTPDRRVISSPHQATERVQTYLLKEESVPLSREVAPLVRTPFGLR